MLTQEEKVLFSEILETLGETLDISESQYDAAVKSYGAVGEWLAKKESSLAPYNPVIRPQGSFMLGTMIMPINEKDDLDIDLVCELRGKNPTWSQYQLKQAVGNRLKANPLYYQMLDKEEGRRCWTLIYAESSNYHMDILPSLVNNDFQLILEKAYSSAISDKTYESLAIRITDKKLANYYTEIDPENWMKSNPFGYGRWFFNQAEIALRKTVMLSDSVSPVPRYNKEKLPLQRVVQLLKRHRDMIFNGHEDKPISIIITTLAAKAYHKENNVIDALENIVMNMENFVETRIDPQTGKRIKWIANPVNPEENFADKWIEKPQKEANFYKWLSQVKQDIAAITQQRGIPGISNAMIKPFGENSVTKAFSIIAERKFNLREQGNLKMSKGNGILSATGSIPVPPHNFHGNE